MSLLPFRAIACTSTLSAVKEAGEVTISLVSDTCLITASICLNNIEIVVSKLLPVIVTKVPPFIGPSAGLIESIIGFGGQQ